MSRLKSLALVLAAGASALALAGTVQAQTLEETLALAYNSNPTLQAERARLRSTDEGRIQAQAGRLPTVSASASITRSHSEGESFSSITNTTNSFESDATPKNFGLSASQPIYRGGRIDGAIDQATAVVMAGRESLRATEQTVLIQAVTTFMDVRRDGNVVEIRQNNVEVLAQQLRAAQDRFEVGEITRTDVSQAEARLSLAQAQLSAAQAQLAASRAAYERVTGQPAASLSAPPALPALPDNLADAAEYAFDNSPQLLAARYSEEASQHAIRIARGALRPEVSLTASASSARDSSFSGDVRDSASIMGQVSVPIFTGGLNRSRIRAAVAQEEQARHQVREARRQVTEAVTNAWYGYVTSLAVIESSRQAVVANEIALDGVQQEAFVGIRTTLDVLNAEQELLESRLTFVTAERDSFVAGYLLLQAMGLASAEQLGLNVDIYDAAAADSRESRFPNLDLTPWD
ncbi:type I secretion outer membrane protein, TolC family [Maricaulis maris MCS10]|jgi:outer membrane protein|uniref:Type I secretion outer membrane protein, TolC family n=1 Tax=Maricaulis maris (strain MCS10) TaxID=394221 RepID=Q0AQZ1_MARMM|nr:TolC family outer membrane protein [Maricaulis maris]ABI65296.1 type I secretion outer membrane protein, TolC family [Maricaulis maris MCS10]